MEGEGGWGNGAQLESGSYNGPRWNTMQTTDPIQPGKFKLRAD